MWSTGLTLFATLFLSAQFSIFSFGWLHTTCTADTQLYIADTTTEELLVYSFYLNKCPHLQCFGSVWGRPFTLHLVVLFMTSNVCSTSNAPLSKMQGRIVSLPLPRILSSQYSFFPRTCSSRRHPYTSDGYCLSVIKEVFFLYRPRHRLIKHLGGEGGGGSWGLPNKVLSGARPLQALTPLYLTFTEPT